MAFHLLSDRERARIAADGIVSLPNVAPLDPKTPVPVTDRRCLFCFGAENLQSYFSRSHREVRTFCADCLFDCLVDFRSQSTPIGRVNEFQSQPGLEPISDEHLADIVQQSLRLDENPPIPATTVEFIMTEKEVAQLRQEIAPKSPPAVRAKLFPEPPAQKNAQQAAKRGKPRVARKS